MFIPRTQTRPPSAVSSTSPTASLRAAAVGSIIARTARPGSERAARRWLGERSAPGELLGVDFQTLGPMQLYRASDALMTHRQAIVQQTPLRPLVVQLARLGFRKWLIRKDSLRPM